MKYMFCFILALSLAACSSKSGKEEKELATQAFINCDFYGAIDNSKIAIQHADNNLEVSVPALLILGKSFELLDNEAAASSAYENIVRLAPGVTTLSEAKQIADNFVAQLSKTVPQKIENCPALQS